MRQVSLLYHDVLSDDSAPSGFPGADADVYKLTRRQFEAHLAEIASTSQGRVQLVSPSWPLTTTEMPVLLTFDDGGSSAHDCIASLLEAQGWRGHFFVVTSRIAQPGFLSAEQIRDLSRRGHHIGSHSHVHPEMFSELSDEEMLREWGESRQILGEILRSPPCSASVPGGFYSRRVAAAAQKAGYGVVFNSEPTTVVSRVAGLLVLGRYMIQRHTPPPTARSLVRADSIPRAIQYLAWNAKKPLKKLGGKGWMRFRRWFFDWNRRQG